MSLIVNNICPGGCGSGSSGSSGGGGGTTGVSNHEQLSGLMGGNGNGHYHVTAEQWQKIGQLLTDDNFQKLLDLIQNGNDFIYDGGSASTAPSAYVYYLEGGASDDSGGTIIGGGGA